MTPASKTERVALRAEAANITPKLASALRRVMRVMSFAEVAPTSRGAKPDRQDEAAAAQRDVVGDAPVDVALAQDALLGDVVERERVVGIDALQPVFLVALDDRALRGIQVRDRSGKK